LRRKEVIFHLDLARSVVVLTFNDTCLCDAVSSAAQDVKQHISVLKAFITLWPDTRLRSSGGKKSAEHAELVCATSHISIPHKIIII
jgi:hypothetical protein